jgi:hypothetical protein
MCVCVCVEAGTHLYEKERRWGRGDRCVEISGQRTAFQSCFSFHPVEPGDQAEVVSLEVPPHPSPKLSPKPFWNFFVNLPRQLADCKAFSTLSRSFCLAVLGTESIKPRALHTLIKHPTIELHPQLLLFHIPSIFLFSIILNHLRECIGKMPFRYIEHISTNTSS